MFVVCTFLNEHLGDLDDMLHNFAQNFEKVNFLCFDSIVRLTQVPDGETDEEKELEEAKGNVLLVPWHVVGHVERYPSPRCSL